VTAERRPPDGWIHAVLFRQARGALRVAQHRPEEALEDLLAAAAGWRDLYVTNPAIASWRSAAVAAHRALGQHEEAAALAAEQLALARETGNPITLGIALRVHGATRGQVRDLKGPAGDPARPAGDPARPAGDYAGPAGDYAGPAGDYAGPAGDLAEAVRVLEATPARYELALALADHGASLRRAGQRTQARGPLLRALDLAERTGAAALAAEVRQELLAVGARPRRAALTGPDALTSTERRVAALAADGLSNRQIAEHLFVTQATVETHLRHAFRKLGITTRADLPSRLGT
jgi:DNA-binding CsgD family transcriptional regulator